MNEVHQIPWPDWQIVKIIGRGSYGTVYEIQRTLASGETESAALKVIKIPQSPADIESMYSEGFDAEAITETFREHLKGIMNEYELMQKLDGHTNIVNSKDISSVQHDDGMGWDIFIRMELLTPLMQSLPNEITDEMVINLGIDICKALQLCNKHNIIHRDIKPQNIFVSKNGDYKLGDFGIAKEVEKTVGGTKIGTYKYMAPEVYYSKPYGQSADVYSLGLVLYWMLNERRMPFAPPATVKMTTSQDEEARNRRLAGEPLPPPAHGSKALKQIVLKACAFDPKDRYNSADELLSDIEKVKNGTFIATSGSRNGFSDKEGTMGPMGFSNDEQTTGPDWKKTPKKGNDKPPISAKVILAIVLAAILIVGAIALVVGFSEKSILVVPPLPTNTQPTKTTETNTENKKDSSTPTTSTLMESQQNAGVLYRPESYLYCDQHTKYVSGYYENQGYVKMRYGPSKYEYDVIRQIDNGNQVTVETDSINGWSLVYFEETEGWVRSDFLFDTYEECFDTVSKQEPDITVDRIVAFADVDDEYDGEPLNMRSGPSREYQLITTVPDESYVAILGYSDNNKDWIYVEYSGNKGWILNRYVKEIAQLNADEVFKSYLSFLKNEAYHASVGQAYAAVEDVNGDSVPELILEAWDDSTVVYTYDFEAQKMIQLVSKPLGKGYNMQAYYNVQKQQVICPSANTGGYNYEVVMFAGNETALTKSLVYTNARYSTSGNEEFEINGLWASAEEFQVAVDSLYDGFSAIDTTIEEIIITLQNKIK